MTVDAPRIDSRDQAMLVEQVRKLALKYCPVEYYPDAWKDIASIQSDKKADALIHIFARMMEIIIQRLDKVPDKNFLAFLDLIGVRLFPPRTARAAMVFTMAKGATKFGFIPAGTQIAGETKEQETVVFETEKALTVILPRLAKAVSLSPDDDRWADHSSIVLDKANEAVELFRGKDLVPHRLYLGHKLFSFNEKTTIKIKVNVKEPIIYDKGAWDVKWYCYKEDSKEPVLLNLTDSRDMAGNKDDAVAALLKGGYITFSDIAGVAEKTLKGFENQTGLQKTWKSNWIFAELKKPVKGKLPVITKITAGVVIETVKSQGSGTLSSNDLKITGTGTKFTQQLKKGDAITVARGTEDQTRLVLSVNQDNSLVINYAFESEFTGNIFSYSSYHPPDCAFFNNFQLDLTKDFHPFGEKARFNDTLYISSMEAFSKSGADITVLVALSEGHVPDTTNIKLVWESWDGKNWTRIGETTQEGVKKSGGFSDSTCAFKLNGQVTFKCPKIEAKKLYGEEKENYWIRIRIIGGNYGEEATYEEKTATNATTVWTYKPPTFKPPSINILSLMYKFTPPEYELETILTYGDFLYQEQVKNFFLPFQPMKDKNRALYLGFDENIATLPVTIFFPLLEKTAISKAAQGNLPSEEDKENVSLVWEYWTGKNWNLLKVEDNTNNIAEREMIQFQAPSDVAKKPCFDFEAQYYWIRARLEKGTYEAFPRLGAIYTNTVWARNQVTIQNEMLGYSNGNPDQVFKFSRSPILPGQKVLVMEFSLTEEEKRIVISEENGKDAIEEIKDNAGNVTGSWVRWHQVEHFYFSNPNSRHYIIDRNNGTITFGDGERGMIPPAGKDNIKCSYKAGGGARGNIKAGKITKLRTSFPYIDSVTNPEDADGGGDKEEVGKIIERGPQTLKHRDRAVTCEDFVWLVREASPKVVRVKCLPTTGQSLQNEPGCVTLIIVPESDDPKPLPSQQLINEIENYIFERTSTYLKSYPSHPSQINLIGPGYIKVWVEASIQLVSISEAKIIEGRIMDTLNRFFHPVYGGPDKKGWDFGRNVYISEVYEAIENTEGVDHVDVLHLYASAQMYQLSIEPITSHDSYPVQSTVSSKGGDIIFSLAESLPGGEIRTLKVTGFKEGDSIILGSVNLTIRSVSHDTLYDVLECEPMLIEESIPIGSVVETSDKKIKSVILNEIPAQGDVSLTPIQVAMLKVDDEITIKNADNPLKNTSGKITGVDIHLDTIFIDDNYLVYSGEHIINKNEIK